jgi:HEAT repeat protein
MITDIIAAALLALQPAQAGPAPSLDAEQQALVRCAAAFALVSHGQDIGNEAAGKWPKLGERGREFFVRSLALLMDQTGLGREGIAALVAEEAQRLWDTGETDKVMPACLLMLEGSGV